MSRFRNVYVCKDCGIREAFEGDFWFVLYESQKPAITQQQQQWRETWAQRMAEES